MLDTITLVHGFLAGSDHAKSWVRDMGRVLKEESLAYTIDERGGVHRAIDAEFDQNLETAIRALGGSRYVAVSAALTGAFKKFDRPHQDLKGSVRDLFEAAETLTKLLAATSDNLDSVFVKKRLQPIVDRTYAGDGRAASAAGRMLASFEDWVDAAHPLRHGHQTEEAITLPQDLAVALLSAGASFIRWLADIDRRQQS